MQEYTSIDEPIVKILKLLQMTNSHYTNSPAYQWPATTLDAQLSPPCHQEIDDQTIAGASGMLLQRLLLWDVILPFWSNPILILL